MKKLTVSTISMISIFFLTLTLQATAAETNQTKLLASLNGKTAKIKSTSERENKINKITTREETVNSYVFALDQKKLQIEYKEEIRTFKNGAHTETDTVAGKVSMDLAKIDQKKIATFSSPIDLICLDRENCIDRDGKNINYQVAAKKESMDANKDQTFMFQIRVPDQSIAKQIHQELKDLLALVAPPEKAAEKKVAEDKVGENKVVEKPETPPVVKK